MMDTLSDYMKQYYVAELDLISTLTDGRLTFLKAKTKPPYGAPLPDPIDPVIQPKISQITTDYSGGNVTTMMVTLPNDWDTSDEILLVLSRNASTIGVTADNGVVLTPVVEGSGMMAVYKVSNPVESFTITTLTNHLCRYAALTLKGTINWIDAVVDSQTDTTSVVPAAPINHSTSPQDEKALLLAICTTNSTAVWTGPSGFVEEMKTTSGNATLGIWSREGLDSGETTTPPDADRGNDGSARNEAYCTLVVSDKDMSPL